MRLGPRQGDESAASTRNRLSDVVHGHEQMVRRLRAQKLDRGIAPADGTRDEARLARGFEIADLVSDHNGARGTRLLPLDDGLKLGSLAEQRSAAGILTDPFRVLVPQNTTDIRFGVGGRDRNRNTALDE